MNDDLHHLIGTGEAARILGVDPTTVARWADDGALPFVQTIGGHRRFVLADVESLAADLARDHDGSAA